MIHDKHLHETINISLIIQFQNLHGKKGNKPLMTQDRLTLIMQNYQVYPWRRIYELKLIVDFLHATGQISKKGSREATYHKHKGREQWSITLFQLVVSVIIKITDFTISKFHELSSSDHDLTENKETQPSLMTQDIPKLPRYRYGYKFTIFFKTQDMDHRKR